MSTKLAAMVLELDEHISLHELFASDWEAIVAEARKCTDAAPQGHDATKPGVMTGTRPAVAAPLGFAKAVRLYGDEWTRAFPFDQKTETWKGISAATMCSLGEIHTSDFRESRHMLMCTKHGRLFQVD